MQNFLACNLEFWLSVVEEVSFCEMLLGIPKKEAAMRDDSEDEDDEVVCVEELRWKC